MRITGRTLLQYIALIVLLFLTACGETKATPSNTGASPEPTAAGLPDATETSESAGVETEPSPPPSSVVVLTATPINGLDPYRMPALNPEGSVAAHIFDTLIWINNDLELEPKLAQSWKLINNLTWEVSLRQGITFQNNEPVNAEAVRFSVERAQTLPGSFETFATDVQLKQVEIIDNYTIRFQTEEPVANFPYYLASLEILPPVYYQNSGDKNPMGSGPYQFIEQQPDGRITLKSVPNYWGGPPQIETLVFQPVADVSERVAELAAGQADLITNLSPDQANSWDSSQGRLETVESTRRLFVGLRVDGGAPLADKRVRQALNYAIDVQSVVNSLQGGYGQRYGSWVNPPYNNTDLSMWPYDVDKAKILLAEAGYEQGFDIIMDAPIGRYHQDQAVARAIADQLGQVGIRVEVRSYEWPIYVNKYLLPRQMGSLFLLGFNSRGNGWEDTRNLSFNFPYNLTGWQNPEFEQILREAQGTFNERQSQALLNKAQVIGYEEAPWIWLWREYEFYGVNPGLEWQPRPDGLIYLYQPIQK